MEISFAIGREVRGEGCIGLLQVSETRVNEGQAGFDACSCSPTILTCLIYISMYSISSDSMVCRTCGII